MYKRIFSILILCILLCTSCTTETPVVLASTNLHRAMVNLDVTSMKAGESFISIADTTYPTAMDEYPIFVNGSLSPAFFHYDGTSVPAVSLTELTTSLCGGTGFAEISGDENQMTVRYAIHVEANAALHSEDLTIIQLTEGTTDVIQTDANGEETITLSGAVDLTVDEVGIPDVQLSYEDAAAVLGLAVSFYDAEDAAAWEGHTQTNGAAYYLNGVPHLMYWRYPEKAAPMEKEEAVRQVYGALVTAYENQWGPYPVSGVPTEWTDREAEQMYRIVENLTVTDENDRFWRIPVVYDFLVDKYTGDIVTYYNGMSKVFAVFDPLAKGALAFPG